MPVCSQLFSPLPFWFLHSRTKEADPTSVMQTFSANGTQTASAISLWRSALPAEAFKLEMNMAQRVDWKCAATMSGLWTGKVDCAGISDGIQSNGRMGRRGRAIRLIDGI
jgi:hypothetical protein